MTQKDLKNPPAHETKTPSGIVIADPDQGTRHVVLSLDIQGQIDVWEPTEDGKGGDNLKGFMERWEQFRTDPNQPPHLPVFEPRFGHLAFITRNAIDRVNWIGLGYRRKEDTRAGVRSLVQPQTRMLSDGSIEVLVPR